MADVIGHVARKIREFREANGLTQSALAKKLDVTANTVSRWESGTYKPKIEDLDRLSRAFDQPIWAFFPGGSKPPTEAHKALLSATGDLPEEDVHELIRYAEFVRARKVWRKARA